MKNGTLEAPKSTKMFTWSPEGASSCRGGRRRLRVQSDPPGPGPRRAARGVAGAAKTSGADAEAGRRANAARAGRADNDKNKKVALHLRRRPRRAPARHPDLRAHAARRPRRAERRRRPRRARVADHARDAAPARAAGTKQLPGVQGQTGRREIFESAPALF